MVTKVNEKIENPVVSNLTDTIELHGKCIEILEAMQCFQNRIKMYKESINSYLGQFPSLKTKYTHKIDIAEMAILRLFKQYVDLLQTSK